MSYRQTGRTFRTLLNAMLSASDGRPVVLVAHSHDHARQLKESVKRMAEAYGVDTYDGFRAGTTPWTRGLRIGPTGSGIVFTGPFNNPEKADYFKAARFEVIYDHHDGRG